MPTLEELKNQNRKEKYPSFPEKYYPKGKGKGTNTTNSLTGAVIDYVTLRGGFAARINTTGNYIEGEEFTDVLGRKTLTKGKWIKSGATNGVSDVIACFRGRFLALEIKSKTTKDKQSEDQKKVERSINQSGGIYLIISDFDSFQQWFDKWVEECC